MSLKLSLVRRLAPFGSSPSFLGSMPAISRSAIQCAELDVDLMNDNLPEFGSSKVLTVSIELQSRTYVSSNLAAITKTPL